MQAAIAPPLPERKGSEDTRNEPQEQANQVDPDSILHPRDARVHLRIGVDVQRAEQAEDCAPEGEENDVPGEEDGDGPVGDEEVDD